MNKKQLDKKYPLARVIAMRNKRETPTERQQRLERAKEARRIHRNKRKDEEG